MNIKISVGEGYPSWHIDKSFDEVIDYENKGLSLKYSHSFVFTLKGLPTIFLPTNTEIRDTFFSIAKEGEFVHESQNIGDVIDSTTAVEARAAVFMRSSEYGSIHTAPNGKDRVVFVISPLVEETTMLLNDYFASKYN